MTKQSSIFSRLMARNRAIDTSPNVIDARMIFEKRARDVALQQAYRKPKGRE